MARDRGEAGLWDRCRSTVERLELPEPFDAEAFVDLLARERGRPIGLLPVAARPDVPCGLVVTTRAADWIVYCSDTSPLHRQHILLHEAAHILCGHTQRDSEPDEREAELVASLILQRVSRRDRHRARAAGRPSKLNTLFAIFQESGVED
jgi:hypothetical protein